MSAVCAACSTVAAPDARFCANCGRSFSGAFPVPPPPPTTGFPPYSAAAAQTADKKNGLATAGLVCGILSFLFFPVILGPLGIVFGGISWKAGNQRGLTAAIISIIGLPVGMLLGVMMST